MHKPEDVIPSAAENLAPRRGGAMIRTRGRWASEIPRCARNDSGGGNSKPVLETLGPALQLLPYQRRWVEDHSPLKVVVKARQIGYSFAASIRALLECLKRKTTWIFLSKGERQSRLLMEKVQEHVQVLRDSGPGLRVHFLRRHADQAIGSPVRQRFGHLWTSRQSRHRPRLLRATSRWTNSLSIPMPTKSTPRSFPPSPAAFA